MMGDTVVGENGAISGEIFTHRFTGRRNDLRAEAAADNATGNAFGATALDAYFIRSRAQRAAADLELGADFLRPTDGVQHHPAHGDDDGAFAAAVLADRERFRSDFLAVDADPEASLIQRGGLSFQRARRYYHCGHCRED